MILYIGNKYYDFKDNCPDEVINVFKNSIKEISYDYFIKYKDFWPKSKKKVFGNCDVCGKHYVTSINSLISKKKLKSLHYRLICKNCIMSQACNDEDWKITNSNAQFIAQNRPEVKKKMSDSLKKTWSDDERAKKWIEGMKNSCATQERKIKHSIASKKMWQNKEFVDKQMKNCKSFNGITGIFNSKNSGQIHFDSAYEFVFIFYMDLKNKKIQRFNGYIEYIMNNEMHRYVPDFVIDNCIYEIKSEYFLRKGPEGILLKKDAAEKYVNDNDFNDYYLLYEKELEDYCNLKYKYHLLSFCIDNNIVKLYSKEKNEKYGKIYKRKKYYNESVEIFNKWNLLK